MGIRIATADRFTLDYNGARFECRRLDDAELMNLGRAHVADERNGKLDDVALITAIATAAIQDWSGVSDEDSGAQLAFAAELVRFLPWIVRADVATKASAGRFALQKAAPPAKAPSPEVELGDPLSAPSDSSIS